MRDFKVKSLLSALIIAMLISVIGISNGFCGDDKECFVDYDGDGINDNIDDSDGDAIPDNADPDYEKPSETEVDTGGFDFGSTISDLGLTADVGKNSEKFGANEFCARALSGNRCGFTSEEGFGGEGLGVDVGGGGGACAGGVCR